MIRWTCSLCGLKVDFTMFVLFNTPTGVVALARMPDRWLVHATARDGKQESQMFCGEECALEAARRDGWSVMRVDEDTGLQYAVPPKPLQ